MTDVTYQNGWPVPAGWKLVPVEPTYELKCEVGGVRMDEDSFLYEYADGDYEKIGEICRAVVKYSPPPPKAPDYNPGPLEVSVVGMPEFDALIDHIYEEGTSSEGVIHLANKLVRAAIQSHMRYARNAQPVAYQWDGVLIRAEESHPVHRKEGQPLYAAPVAAQTADDARDAERYRLLRKGAVDDVAVVRGLGAMDYGMRTVVYTYSEEIDGDDLDAAIAKATGQKGGGA